MSEFIYDQVLYQSEPISAAHPWRLESISRIFGLKAQPLSYCNVLELGCGNGANIYPLAYSFPQSKFVGVDLSHVQILDGRKIATQLGLNNLELLQADIENLGEFREKFDYIIVHGIISWVPSTTRDKIFSIIRANLACDGVAYVSYNTYPGWHLRTAIRDILLRHVTNLDQGELNTTKARLVLAQIEESLRHLKDPYSVLLLNEIGHVKSMPDWYLRHDYLSEVNNPFYISDLAAIADRFDLQYLADSELAKMATRDLPEIVQKNVLNFPKNIIEREQYLDYIRNRSFRRTLFCRKEIKINRKINADVLKNAYIGASFTAKAVQVETAEIHRISFRNKNGGEIVSDSAFSQEAFRYLSHRWPEAVSFAELCRHAAITEPSCLHKESNESLEGRNKAFDEKCQILASQILLAFTCDLLNVYYTPPIVCSKISKKPQASHVAFFEAYRKDLVCNLLHELVLLDSVDKQLLLLLNGETTLEEVVAKMEEVLKASAAQNKLSAYEETRQRTERFAKEALLLA